MAERDKTGSSGVKRQTRPAKAVAAQEKQHDVLREKPDATEEAQSLQDNEVPMSDEGAGEVRIATDVIVVIAHAAVTETEGVAGMSAGITDNIQQVLGLKGGTKGVKVEISGQEVTLDIFLIVEYGARIPDVAWRAQEKVKQAVESMTGLDVKAINVHVQGVSFDGKTAS